MNEITAIILTYNEAPNIERTLKNLENLPKVLVIDSFSTDQTVEIAQKFKNVSVHQRQFDEHTRQWEFARSLVQTEWTLALDADYQVPEALLSEIGQIITQKEAKEAYMADFLYSIDGEVIRSGIYPSVCVLYRTQACFYEKDGHTQRLKTPEMIGFLQHKIIHDDRKDFRRWILSQLNYARLEAEKLSEMRLAKQSNLKNELEAHKNFSKNDRIRLKFKIAPVLVFFYCIFVRRGWKDGSAGWKYAFQRMIAEILLQYYLLDSKK